MTDIEGRESEVDIEIERGEGEIVRGGRKRETEHQCLIY